MISTLLYNGLTIGAYSSGYLLGAQMGFDLPTVRIDVVDRGSADGARVNTPYFGRRAMSIEGEIWGNDPADFETKRRAFTAAFNPKAGLRNTVITTKGGQTYQVDSIIVNTLGMQYSKGKMITCPFRLELVAPFPYFQSDILQTYTLGIGQAGGGQVPSQIPFEIGGYTQSQPAHNNGTADAYPIITIYGPIVNPIIQNSTTGKTINITQTLTVSDTVEIDVYKRTVLFNTNTNIYALSSGNIGDFLIALGANVIKFYGTGTSDQTRAIISYRDTYLGL